MRIASLLAAMMTMAPAHSPAADRLCPPPGTMIGFSHGSTQTFMESTDPYCNKMVGSNKITHWRVFWTADSNAAKRFASDLEKLWPLTPGRETGFISSSGASNWSHTYRV